MKKIFLTFICLTLALCVPDLVFAQPGTLDKSFGTNGRVVVPRSANPYVFGSIGGKEYGSMAIQKDGKVLITVGALHSTTKMAAFGIVRLNHNGTLDESFSDDGKAFAEMSNFYAVPWDICIAPDGKIIVTGEVANSRGEDMIYHRFAAVRLNPDGTHDKSFDGDGILLLEEDSGGDSYSVAVQEDGKILLAGYGINPKTNEPNFKIILLNENGSIDTGFGEKGMLFIDLTLGNKIRLQPDKKILISGDDSFDLNSSFDFTIVRLNPGGSLDTSFGSGGKTYIDFDGNTDHANDLVIQDDGKILVSGTTYSRNTPTLFTGDYALARLNGNGTLDSSFAVNGKKIIDFANSDDLGGGLAVQKNGSILMNGSSPAEIELTPNSSKRNFGIVRLLPDGSLDTAFNGDGKQLLDFGSSSWGFGVLIQPDDKIVVGGTQFGVPALARLMFDDSPPPVNLPPSFTKGPDQTILEDTEKFIEHWATDISPGEGEANQTIRFIGASKNKDLFQFPPSPSVNGDLFLKPLLNANGSDTITLVLKDNAGTDNGGIDESSPKAFTVTVIPVNDAPAFTLNTIRFVTKVNSGPQSVKEWASELSKGPGNESGQKLRFLVSNNNNSLFSTPPSIDTSGTLQFTGAKSAIGTAKVTVTLKDDGGTENGGLDQSPSLSFTITINSANEKIVTLYSTTSEGGTGNGGTIIKFVPSSNSLTVLKSFDLNSKEDGYSVTGTLVQGNDKKLYGMTTFGGSKGYGVIFSFDLAKSKYTKLKDFDNANGANPKGGLLLASNGKLYGMTANGGSDNKGVIFSFDPSKLAYTKLKDFTGADGANPHGSLMQATDGKLYGMTRNGGAGSGVIFNVDPTNSNFTKLRNFDNEVIFDFSEGRFPYGNLIQANDGILYGLTSRGGFDTGEGAIFSFDPQSSVYNLIYNFFSQGTEPNGSLIQANDGKLYGMSTWNGEFDSGVIFSIIPSQQYSRQAYSVLHNFDFAEGSRPRGTLIQASDGKLYGMTREGGTSAKGVIFSFDLSSGMYSKLKDFNGDNGASPDLGSSFIEVSIDEINTAPILSTIGNKSINELEDFRFTAKATDKDSPVNTLKFSLANAATGQFPEGATIDKSSGLFCWTPTEAQGPGTYRVKIVVSDGVCTDEEEIEIKVCEINSKPVLATIGDQTVDENKVLTFTATAVDKDIPENTLKFSLADPSAGDFPTGASINASTGAFNWLPSKIQIPGAFRVKVIVSDGAATDEEEFAIHVRKTSPASLTAYPNPSARRATVRFAVPTDEAMVTLAVYDFKGQQINRLYEGRAEASKPYSFDLDGSNLSPGVYLIKLSMSQKAETFKIIITE